MSFSFDNNSNLKQSKMFLYNSKTKPVGILSGTYNVKLEQNFHKLFELNFKIYKNINNEENEFYDNVIKNKLIEVQYINWFQILSAVEKYDDSSKETYKEVKCYPLENMLIYRRVDDIVGVFGLYDITDVSKSLLHIISAECGWSIGHVSNSLIGKYRTFNIDSMEIYNLLTTTISDSFGCVFQFDSYTKTINAYLLSELEDMTDIIISNKNILKEYIIDDSDNAIITKMRVKGGNDLDIRSVNFGRNYLVNLDYYMTDSWVSQGLVDAYNLYQTDYNNIRTSFNTSLATLKTKNAELTILKAELKDLESLKLTQEKVMGISVQSHGRVPIPSDSDYTIYQNAVTLVNAYISQISIKKSQIVTKQNEIDSVQETLDSISDSIDESNYFTNTQIEEMNDFIVEGDDFEDSTFLVTDITTEEEALEIKTELMQVASEDLFIKSRPNYTFKIKASNLFTIQDDKDELISYSEWVEQFKIGSLITLNLGSNYMTVRLMTMIIDFDNPEEIELVFSNKNRLDDELIQLAEILADSGRASSALSLKQFGYDAASKLTNPVREFMNGSLNATLNSMINNDYVETEIGEFGIKNRQWLPDQNKYSDYQSWWNQNTLLFSSDGFKTAQAGIGFFENGLGEKFYGVLAPVICGDMVLTSALNISNQNNTITLDKDGAVFTDCDITINKDNNSLYLNAVDGIRLTKGDIDQFYFDSNGNLNFRGNLSGATGTFTGEITASSFIGGYIQSENYIADVLNPNITLVGAKFNLDNGNIYSKNFSIINGDATLKGHVEAESGTIAGFDIVPEGEDNNGGLIYDEINGKFIRISPYSSMDGQGGYNTDYGAIDLGITLDKLNTVNHLRSDGYARFGLAELGGSIRLNDYLRYDAGITGATNTIFYSQKFQIDRDGKIHIESDDVTKPIASIEVTKSASDQIEQLDITFEDNSSASLGVNYNIGGDISQIGDTVITYA